MPPVTWFSAWTFLLTALHARSLGCREIFIGCIACLVTSLAYHWSHNQRARIMDMCVVHGTVCFFIVTAFETSYWDWAPMMRFASVPITIVGISYWILDISRHADFWHVLIHVFGNVSVAMYTSACRDMLTCWPCEH